MAAMREDDRRAMRLCRGGNALLKASLAKVESALNDSNMALHKVNSISAEAFLG